MYTIGAFDRWRVPAGSRIGRYCSIAKTARLVEADHPVDSLTTHPYGYLPDLGVVAEHGVVSLPQTLEDDVWLGHQATILPGCRKIGRGAVIGAGSVVMADVPRYAIMSGNTAKLVRYRFPPHVRAAVEATRWWELDKQSLAAGLKQVPQFGARPTVDNAKAFYRAVHGKALLLDELLLTDPSVRLPTLPRAEVAALFEKEMPTFSAADFATPIATLPIDSFALINLRVGFEARIGTQVHDAAWGALERPEDLVGEGGPSRSASAGHDTERTSSGASDASLAGSDLQPASGSVADARPAATSAAGSTIEDTPAGQIRRYSINMPQMALKGLSEAWLFKELGDMHWSVLLRSLGAASSALTDATGARLYATFTRIRLISDAPLSEFHENHDLVIAMDEQRYGAAMFFGTARLGAPAGQARVELMTTFSKYGEAGVNTSLLKGTPVLPADFPIPAVAALPEFGQDYRTRRAQPLTPALFETEYELLPAHDINGVGLLYFAAYPTIAELCLTRYAGREFAFDYSVIERDIMYFANADPAETLIVRLHRWERTDARIDYEVSISRKSDDKTMAITSASKRRLL